MRTTVDIDDDVLQMAKEIAKFRKATAGKVISDLARQALTQPTAAREIIIKDGFPLMKSTGAVVTSELVDRLLYQAELEDDGLSGSSD